MYKILIADDVKNNRRAIKLALSDLEEEMKIEYYEAENGEEALTLAKENNPDLIFMDVMMPIMDGIEATKAIIEAPEVQNPIIIGLTALDDNETKSKMNNAGVRDFLTKPFDSQELLIRTKNYLELIQTRKAARKAPESKKTITLYEGIGIKNFRVVFKIDSPAALVDFWDYFSNYGSFDKSLLNDQVNLIVTVTKVLFKVRKISSFDIIAEENEDHIFLTVWNDTFIKAAKKYFEKFSKNLEFIDDGEKLSFKVSTKPLENLNEEPSEIKQTVAKPSSQQVSLKKKEERELVVYDFIDEDDLDDLQETVKDLKSKLLLFSSGGLETEDITEIANIMTRMSSKLKLYPQTFVIANAIDSLADSMEYHTGGFIENSSSVAKLFIGFGNDIELWLNSLFVTGTEDLHFLDDTIVSNTETIKQFGTANNADSGSEEELDDIFDF